MIGQIGVPVTQAEVMVGSINTAYLSAGIGDPVICLHGAGAGAVTWYTAIEPLARHFRVLAPDIVGFGETDKPDAPYDRDYFVKWLTGFMQALGIEKAHLIGLSQGGAIALQLALDHPGRVNKLVLVNAGGLGARPPLAAMLGMIWMNTLPSALANRFQSRYVLHMPANRDVNLGRYAIEVLKRQGGKHFFSQGRGSAVRAIPTSRLRALQQQTLVIWGENDRLFPLAQVLDAIAAIPNATLCRIQAAGHLSLLDQPVAFNTAVGDFLASAGLCDATRT